MLMVFEIENGVLRKYIDNGEEKVTLPRGIDEIGKEVFYGCRTIKEITVPDGVKKIGNGAFKNMFSLKKAVLPDSVMEAGRELFYGCEKLEEVNIPEHLEEIPEMMFLRCFELRHIEIPKSVKKIGTKAFYGAGIEEIVLPDGVTKAENGIFSYCTSLKRAVLPETLEEIGYDLFFGCEELEETRLPEKTRTLGGGTFMNCRKLKEAYIPPFLERLPNNMFNGCSFEKVIIPETVTEITYASFRECGNLKYIEFEKRAKPPRIADFTTSKVGAFARSYPVVKLKANFLFRNPSMLFYDEFYFEKKHYHQVVHVVNENRYWFVDRIFYAAYEKNKEWHYFRTLKVLTEYGEPEDVKNYFGQVRSKVTSENLLELIEIARKNERTETQMILMDFYTESFGSQRLEL